MISTQYLEFSINPSSEDQQPILGVDKPSLNKDKGDTRYLECLTRFWSQVSKRLLTLIWVASLQMKVEGLTEKFAVCEILC